MHSNFAPFLPGTPPGMVIAFKTAGVDLRCQLEKRLRIACTLATRYFCSRSMLLCADALFELAGQIFFDFAHSHE
jgi:hypothetical protein